MSWHADALQRLRDRMPDDVDCVLVSEITNVGWLTGFTGSAGKVLVKRDAAVFVTDSRYTLQAQEEVQGMEVRSFAAPMVERVFLNEVAHDLAIGRLAIDPAAVSYDLWQTWVHAFSGIELVAAKPTFAGLRKVKFAGEIDRIRDACALADAAFAHVERLLQPGVRELDIAIELEFFFRRQGAAASFNPIVVSGERSARPHGVPSEKPLESGDFVTLDFGAKLREYCSDITRTVVIGAATERHEQVYDAVLRAHLAAIDAIQPGMTGKAADAVARESLRADGFGEYFGHGLGHGLGRLVHDPGSLSTSSEDVLEVGQVWTIEPGVYLPGFGGVRIEDDIVLTESGAVSLNSSPKHLMVLPSA
ncbi:MAG: Xaa-Pro peptidase family protein [Fimbriimonadaceae bacterium]|nr:Xaa-Pro peptidase family protein [Fimbriimonadaceae bacterium]